MKKLLTVMLLLFALFSLSPKVTATEGINYEDFFYNHQVVKLIIHPVTGEIYLANQAAADFYGYSLDELMNMNINQINTLSPDEIAAERLKALEEKRNFFIFEHRLSDGKIRTVHVYSFPIEINEETYLYSIIIDQTAYTIIQNRNRLLIIGSMLILIIAIGVTTYFSIKISTKNKEIQKQHIQQDTLISNLPGVAYRCKNDKDFTMTYISKQIYQLTGYQDQDFYNKNITYAQIIHSDDLDQVIKKFDTGSKNDQSVDMIYRIVDINQKIRWVHEIAKVHKNDASHMSYDIEGFIQEVTDKIAADAEASYRKDLLQYIISHSNQGIAVHDKDLNYVYVSERYCEMYHVSKDIIGKNHYEVFPDLPQKWKDVHKRSLKGETLSGDRDEFVRMDGSIQYTRWLSQPWYGMNKDIAGIIIYTEVINDLVETEIELKKTLDRMLLIMDNLTIGIAVNSVNPEVDFEYMNNHFPEFYGTTREALMKSGSFWDEVYEDEVFREEIKQKVLEGLASNDPKLKRWENVPITKNGEIVRYITAQGVNIPNSSLIISMVMDVTEQKERELQIVYTSTHDFLTGLPNRRYFEDKLKELNSNKHYPLLISMIDFDGLKLINDAYGHDMGDEALIKIGKIISSHIRPTDFLSRIGGDEFILLCPCTTLDEFELIKNKIIEHVNSMKHNDMKYSLSFGEAIIEDEWISLQEVLKTAENNMYANKTLHGQSALNETIMTLFEALKEKYDEEKIHSDRVSKLCRLSGQELKLGVDQIKELEFAGLMHDIGKITIPDSILDKPSQLTDDEWVIMKKHTINGYHILRSANKYSRLAEYALTHHERWDGKGYPNGLKGQDIPLFSRIISIADAYEAMTADRPYRKALSQEVAIEELRRCSGTQFDAQLVDIFIHQVIPNE